MSHQADNITAPGFSQTMCASQSQEVSPTSQQRISNGLPTHSPLPRPLYTGPQPEDDAIHVVDTEYDAPPRSSCNRPYNRALDTTAEKVSVPNNFWCRINFTIDPGSSSLTT
ncbi:hypothetical protein OIDMADRAFT_33106 [Oidiodendron maius Zn]|uniref:Uncharacterized protein n=1 Tax=Oidiodendron maius (strain Zn) TaxID=913774 RepID=A0A0C3D3F2_OIDMZ|nr:hypothetical protein OIDMADRAFT_33106 [Oidiodendron maius Zn]